MSVVSLTRVLVAIQIRTSKGLSPEFVSRLCARARSRTPKVLSSLESDDLCGDCDLSPNLTHVHE